MRAAIDALTWRGFFADAPVYALVELAAGAALLVGRHRFVAWWRRARRSFWR